MKCLFYCNFSYAFAILKPIADEAYKRGHKVKWYAADELYEKFPYQSEFYTDSLSEIYDYAPDAVFASGNIVPWFLSGVKAQVFHGLAGEKKGHFRVRDYFDLYLTQGPYFTDKFNQLKSKHKNFEVTETGWSKLDRMYRDNLEYLRKQSDQGTEKNNQESYEILYAPTFSPSLTSAVELFETLKDIADLPGVSLKIKFHDKMEAKMGRELVQKYFSLAAATENIELVNDSDITDSLISADLMISDTSSVVYEFLMLNKPVVTLNSSSDNIVWDDTDHNAKLYELVVSYAGNDSSPFVADKSQARENLVRQYHPYKDGNSAMRMLDAVEAYIEKRGVPAFRKLSFLRKFKLHKYYNYIPSWKHWFK